MCSVRVSTSYTNSDTRRVRVIMWLVLQLPIQSVPIATNIVSSNLDHGEVYNIMWKSLSVTSDRSVVFFSSSGFLHQ